MIKLIKSCAKSTIYAAWPLTLLWGGRYSLNKITKRMNKYDIVLELDLRESVDKLYAYGLYSTKSIDFLIQTIKTTDCTWFVDAGANLGFYTFAIPKHFSGSVQCLCIEPDPYSQAKILENKTHNPSISRSVHLAPFALSNMSSTVGLMINDVGNRGGSSICIDQRQFTGRRENIVVNVQSHTLQNICSQYLSHEDRWCLKIDIEGYEYPVLEAFFSNSLPQSYPLAIVAEWTGKGELGHHSESPIQLLERYGYIVVGKDGLENYLLVRS